jgi:hypothetical protein
MVRFSFFHLETPICVTHIMGELHHYLQQKDDKYQYIQQERDIIENQIDLLQRDNAYLYSVNNALRQQNLFLQKQLELLMVDKSVSPLKCLKCMFGNMQDAGKNVICAKCNFVLNKRKYLGTKYIASKISQHTKI